MSNRDGAAHLLVKKTVLNRVSAGTAKLEFLISMIKNYLLSRDLRYLKTVSVLQSKELDITFPKNDHSHMLATNRVEESRFLAG